jgi:hypothetical protein
MILHCALVLLLSFDVFVDLVLMTSRPDGGGDRGCGRQAAVVLAIGDGHRPGTLVALTDDLERQVGGVFVDG